MCNIFVKKDKSTMLPQANRASIGSNVGLSVNRVTCVNKENKIMTQPLTSPEYQPLLRTALERLIAVAPTETGYPGSTLDSATLEHDDASRG